jgi:hypothetical protein
MNIDWKLFRKNLEYIYDDDEYVFIKNYEQDKFYIDQKVPKKKFNNGLQLINYVNNSELILNDELKEKIMKELGSLNSDSDSDSESYFKLHELVVKSSSNTNYVKMVYETGNGTDLFVIFEHENEFIIIGVNCSHYYIISSDGWGCGSSDGSVSGYGYDEKNNKLLYYRGAHENIEISEEQFDLEIIDMYNSFCNGCY